MSIDLDKKAVVVLFETGMCLNETVTSSLERLLKDETN